MHPWCSSSQRRGFGIWQKLRPWKSRQGDLEQQQQQQKQQQQHTDSGTPAVKSRPGTAAATSAAAAAAAESRAEFTPPAAPAGPSAAGSAAAGAAAAASLFSAGGDGVIASKFAAAAGGPSSSLRPPAWRAAVGAPGVLGLSGDPPARRLSPKTVGGPPRSAAPFGVGDPHSPGEAGAPHACPSLAAAAAEARRIFLEAAESRPEPRRREGAPPLSRAVRKPMGPLLTRLSRSPVFLQAAAAAAAAEAAAAAAAADPTASASHAAATDNPPSQQQHQQQQQQQQQEQQQRQQQEALFSRALALFFCSEFSVMCGAPQRLLGLGGVRVLHPSRTRGSPDGRPPDLTLEQFSLFAKSLYAHLLKAQLPAARPIAISRGPLHPKP
ncbi:hypothetical protein Efla_000758 [Eimeria flavescens]